MQLLHRGLFLAVFATLGGCSDSEPEVAKKIEPVATAQQAKPAPVAERSLGMTPEEFRRQFNTQMAIVDEHYKLPKFDIQRGDVNDAFSHQLASNVGLVGTVSKKSGEMKEILVMLGAGKKYSDKETLMALAVTVVVAEAANPDIDKEIIGAVIPKMITKALGNIDNGKSEELTVGGVTYLAAASAVTGLMFSVSPAK
ncbi:hypothetical protein HBDW_25980 [Herbaspirillum sp. DW155]|uniref:hypothetical protein n=1 Tax=Herbaspirillum sp. DW155 TaxID=3095609 RepID=UPI003086D24D|nr:hypothetical protein HBDW_25980 [Herbaspirillum sp. DW155]